MSPEDAIKTLKGRIKLPTWAYSVWIWYGEDKPELYVRLDPRFMHDEAKVPLTHEGFRVRVKTRDPAVFAT